jgi:hypothetical protein
MSDVLRQIAGKFKILNLCYKDRGSFLTISETMKLSFFHSLPEKGAYAIFDLTKGSQSPSPGERRWEYSWQEASQLSLKK